MTDHEKLMLVLIGSDEPRRDATVTVGDVVSMLYELGARYRDQAGQRHVLAAAS